MKVDVTTQFDEGSSIFFMSNNKPTKASVKSIEISVSNSKTSVSYWTGSTHAKDDECFTSMQSLQNSLFAEVSDE